MQRKFSPFRQFGPCTQSEWPLGHPTQCYENVQLASPNKAIVLKSSYRQPEASRPQARVLVCGSCCKCSVEHAHLCLARESKLESTPIGRISLGNLPKARSLKTPLAQLYQQHGCRGTVAHVARVANGRAVFQFKALIEQSCANPPTVYHAQPKCIVEHGRQVLCGLPARSSGWLVASGSAITAGFPAD